jgi:hypothetical protein
VCACTGWRWARSGLLALWGSDLPALWGTDLLALRGTDLLALWGSDLPALRGTDLLALRGTDLPALRGTDPALWRKAAVPVSCDAGDQRTDAWPELSPSDLSHRRLDRVTGSVGST